MDYARISEALGRAVATAALARDTMVNATEHLENLLYYIQETLEQVKANDVEQPQAAAPKVQQDYPNLFKVRKLEEKLDFVITHMEDKRLKTTLETNPYLQTQLLSKNPEWVENAYTKTVDRLIADMNKEW